jgi:hypothetical protein
MTWLHMMLGLPSETRLLVGTDTDPDDGSLRVYVNARYTGIHTHIPAGSEDAQRFRNGFGSGHAYADIPDDALCDCHPELTRALARAHEVDEED